MGNSDISRNIFNPKKHYTSVRNQQGRVLTDDDWNENERISNEIERRTNVDVIGPNGSPDNGFRIKKGSVRTTDNVIDFDIMPGTYYLGGLRLKMDPAGTGQSPDQQTFRTQKDWLQQEIESYNVPEIDEGKELYDLIYLEAWQQTVTAVEDSELYEAALGGPDTTTRIRNMARVSIKTDIGSPDCINSWKKLTDTWQEADLRIINEDHELITDARLKVTYTEGRSEDLCSPSIIGGYLGAENQAIRVQLTGKDKLTWGFDNASSLYRIKLTRSSDTFKLITAPKDQYHWPLAGQVVEILPWSAVLINGEKTAALTGHLSKVKTSYNPDTSEIIIEDPISVNFGNEWKNRPDHDEIAGSSEYYYLRVWNRGSDLMSSPEINFTEGSPITLGNTGIQITITGNSRRIADYWIIAARPETPGKVVPWELEEGIPPNGIRRYFAPLAILRWRSINGVIKGEVIHDCRKTFRPLTGLETCCTFTVGNGKDNKGDFNSIQEAIDNLPENGGKVCILPGVYEGNIVISKRKHIWITGCSEQTIVMPKNTTYPVFNIHNSQGIKLTNMTISSEYGKVILVQDSKQAELPSNNIQIYENNIIARIYAIKIRVNNDIAGNNDIQIRHNRIGMIDDENGQTAISTLADSVIIEKNKIVVIPPPDAEDSGIPQPKDNSDIEIFDPCAERKVISPNILFWISQMLTYIRTFSMVKSFKTLGGIQIEGGSEYIKILGNEIVGGKGNGITLGSSLGNKKTIYALDTPDETKIVEINNDKENVMIRTASENMPAEGIEVMLKRTSETASGISSTNGKLNASLKPGAYSAYIATPGYNIADVKNNIFAKDEVQHIIFIEKMEHLEPVNELPPVYDVLVEGNTISNMGLSGIGSASFQNAENLGREFYPMSYMHNQLISPLLMGMVEDLDIKNNKITYCAQQLPDVVPENTGFGGIVLSSCENITIEGNYIADNGISHLEPICGIYIFHGDKIEIEHNRILNNGKKVQQSSNQNIKKGIRGGVYIRLTVRQIFNEFSKDKDLVVPDAIPAVKIHNNIITQSFGQSLFIMAYGPVTVTDNQLTTQDADYQVNPFSAFAGSVIVFNLGMSKDLFAKFIAANFSFIARANISTSSSNIYQNFQQYLFLPNGNILFANNQVTLDLRTEDINFALSSQLIVSLDDVAYNNNQSEITSYIDTVITDAAIVAATIRTNNNRFQEGFTFSMYSLFSYGFMNTAIANQGSHCLLILGQYRYLVNEGNIAFLDNRCERLTLLFKRKYTPATAISAGI